MADLELSEDEASAEYFDHHEDAGELLDPLVDNAEADEAMETKLKELDRLAQFGVYETVDLHVALEKKRLSTRWHTDHTVDGIRARFVAREFKGDETMCDVVAPSSTPSTGRITDNLSLKKLYHTFRADVTNACDIRKQLHGRRPARTRWVDFMTECVEEQSFD